MQQKLKEEEERLQREEEERIRKEEEAIRLAEEKVQLLLVFPILNECTIMRVTNESF